MTQVLHSCKMMLLGQKSLCCKYQLVPAGSCSTWEDDPSPWLFSNAEILGENPASARLRLVRPCFTCEALPEVCFHLSGGTLQNATAKDEDFPAPLPQATKGWLSSPASCSALMTLRLGELKNTPGRAKKILWTLIRVSALCFPNKLQINYAYSSLSCLSW